MTGTPIRALRYERLEALTAPENEAQVLRALTERIGKGQTYQNVCEELGVPYSGFLTWLQEDAARWNVFLKAHEAKALHHVSETVGIADDPDLEPADKKVRIDTRFKLAKHHAPGLYGDKLDVKLPDNIGEAEILERIKALVAANPRLKEMVVGKGVVQEDENGNLTVAEEGNSVSDAVLIEADPKEPENGE